MNWKKWLNLLLFTSLIVLLIFWLRSDFWLVEKTECRLDDQTCPADLFGKITELSLGKNLVFFPENEVKKKISQFFPYLNDSQIKKRVPDIIFFDFKTKRALVALAVDVQADFALSGVFYWLDQDGTVLEKTDKADNLPLVLIAKDPNLNIGQRFSQEESSVLMPLLLGLKMHMVDFKIVRIISFREIQIWLSDGMLVVFNGGKEIEGQLDSLQLILSRSKIEGKSIKKIDLRFDKPVID